MCRWAAYLGEPIFMDGLVTSPGHSLVHQSRAASECKTALNGDGVGVAWYGERAEPGLYRDVYPAWSDPNLAALCSTVKSHAFMAHVRASTGSATSRNNCHPFACGRWSFMHNGQVGGFDRFRRLADMGVSDALYAYRRGATDSELCFSTRLPKVWTTRPRWRWSPLMQGLRRCRVPTAPRRTCGHRRHGWTGSGCSCCARRPTILRPRSITGAGRMTWAGSWCPSRRVGAGGLDQIARGASGGVFGCGRGDHADGGRCKGRGLRHMRLWPPAQFTHRTFTRWMSGVCETADLQISPLTRRSGSRRPSQGTPSLSASPDPVRPAAPDPWS